MFLTPFASARLLAPDKSREPNPDCLVCGVYYTSVTVDIARATLNDIVEGFLKESLGYEDKEFVVSNEVGILYDVEETDNLDKKLSDLGMFNFTCGANLAELTITVTGIKGGSFLTVMDEDDTPWVNMVIDIQEGFVTSRPGHENDQELTSSRDLGDQEKAFKVSFTDRPEIPRKPVKPAVTETNGDVQQNGKHSQDAAASELPKGVKRSYQGDDDQPLKKAKVAKGPAADDDVVLVEDAGGAIIIDDD